MLIGTFPKHAQHLKLLAFVQSWNTEFKVRLLNCKALNLHPLRPNCKNEILAALINDYRTHSIETLLLHAFEVTRLLRQIDPAYAPGKELGVLIDYRNKFIAHRNECSGSEEFDELYARTRSHPWQIYKDIEVGIEALLRDIYRLVPNLNTAEGTVKSFLHGAFSDAGIGNLIRAAGTQELPKDRLFYDGKVPGNAGEFTFTRYFDR